MVRGEGRSREWSQKDDNDDWKKESRLSKGFLLGHHQKEAATGTAAATASVSPPRSTLANRLGPLSVSWARRHFHSRLVSIQRGVWQAGRQARRASLSKAEHRLIIVRPSKRFVASDREPKGMTKKAKSHARRICRLRQGASEQASSQEGIGGGSRSGISATGELCTGYERGERPR